jgi:hypothetical protein
MLTAMIAFLVTDFRDCWWRAILEIIGMALGVAVAVILATTTPHPPMLLCYTLWVTASLGLGVATWHRGSFGLTAAYLAFFIIDTIGLIRTIIGA